ncbi:hypothetical protein IAU60_004829 [Kwoniella sp. DSM 27419]
MSNPLPPPLPPRRPTGAPSTSSETAVEESHAVEEVLPPGASAHPAASPPPLPQRPATTRPIPAPVFIPEARPVAAPVITTPSTVEAQPTVSGITVAVTPATPTDSLAGTAPASPSFGQAAVSLHTAPLPAQESSASGQQTQPPLTAPPDVPSLDTQPQHDQVRQTPPPLPPRKRKAASVGAAAVPSLAWIVYTSGLVILAYIQVSVTGLALAALAGYIAVKRVETTAEKVARNLHPDGEVLDDPGKDDSVKWVNHALHALFPLISTDVLTPFIDLMEDALAGQMPPVVTSVRLTSPALGSQPVVLTSLRPMTDQEWFKSLSTADRTAKESMNANDTRRSKAAAFTPSVFSPKKKHSRNPTAASADPGPPSSKLTRSYSASSVGSGADSEDLAQETRKRRKRDRIIQKLSRRNMSAPPEDEKKDVTRFEDAMPTKGLGPRPGDDADIGSKVSDGERNAGGDGDDDLDEDDPNAGQYVNYQVGFEYKRNQDAQKKGRGIHVLAYFGWGVKGIGGSEVPVYIDVLSIKGTLNVRLLLSATPPFVRTGTFSLPSLPDYDVSAHPLSKGAFNAMDIPGMKYYVKQSITEVASAFVRPNSYSLDLDRLLLGKDTALRTAHIGVLHMFIHGAEDLPKVDTMGSCDPYVSISFSKYHKPLFSTRTIVDSRDPVWDEESFVLISADAIEAGEKLRLRACDSDRFSADDDLGMVEVDLAELVDTHASKLHHRRDHLQADKPGMRSSGVLNWSVRFHPLWQMSPEEAQKRILAARQDRVNTGEPPDQAHPWWMDWIEKVVDGKDQKWVRERQERRKQTMAWFTGEREHDELEAAMKPSEEMRSGVLQFHIHQCVDLETETNSGTYGSHTSSARSAAAGKPALASLIDRTPTENPDPPSAYTEVHLNDKLVYRTRTKQVTPLPYFNAVSERFVRDWTKGKIVFVVRDERNREHDPILGMVIIPLREAFRSRSQFSRWFPLVGGLGWGRIRLSLLWKPLDMSVPRGVSGFEVAALRLRSFSFVSIGAGLGTDRAVSVVLQTDADKYELSSVDAGEPSPASAAAASASRNSFQSQRDQVDSPSRSIAAEDIEMEFDLSPKHVRLAISYRHSCSLVITFVSRSTVLKKKKVLGMGVVRLPQMKDGEGSIRVGVWGTTDVARVMRVQDAMDRTERAEAGNDGDDREEGVAGLHIMSPSLPSSPGLEVGAEKRLSFKRRMSDSRWSKGNDSSSNPGTPTRPRATSSVRSSRSSLSIRGEQPPLLGIVQLSFNLVPGISKAHRKVAKRDLRFAKVFEAWEASKEVVMGWDKMGEGEKLKREFEGVKQAVQSDGESDSDEEDDGDSGSSGDEEEGGEEQASRREKKRAEDQLLDRHRNAEDSEDEEDKQRSERRAHSKALHKRHKGVFQLKIARTGRFVKDILGAKVHSAANSGGGKDGRPRGSDMTVEKEGISHV